MHFSEVFLARAATATATAVRVRGRLRGGKQLATQKAIRRANTIIIKPKAVHPALAGGKPVGGERLVQNFSELLLRDDVVASLTEVEACKPTVIQMLAIPKILRGKNVLFASETGSGKTLAYLAPLISRLRDEEEHHGLLPRLKRPRALIVLPSRDLAAQVLSVAKSLCHKAKFKAVGLITGTKRKFIREALEKPVDVIVATPSSLLKYRQQERILLSDISHLVLDEADTLLDESFVEATTSIVRAVKLRTKKPPKFPAKAEGAQVTVVGATLTDHVINMVDKLVPNVKKVSSKHLHQVLPHVEQRFVKIRQDEKAEKLASLVKTLPNDVFMVFCNTVPSCDWTARYLRSQDVPLTKLHGGFSAVNRMDLLKGFQRGESRVLVCTDIASRGIDTCSVNHIVLFDFPLNLPDYLHRVGRTGRVGSRVTRPRVSAFMSHRKDVLMAMKIKDAATRQVAIMERRAVSAMNRKPLDATREEPTQAQDATHTQNTQTQTRIAM